MNMKTGLTGLGLFVVAGVLTISCGGSSDSNDNPTAGKGSGGSSASGSSSGGSSSGGKSSSGGSSSNGGKTSSGGTGPGPQGGDNTTLGGDGPVGNNGGAPAGGAGNNPPGCPAAEPTDGEMCTAMTGFQGCDYGTMNCRCQRMGGGQNAMRAWNCNDLGGAGGFPNIGQGGNGNFGNVECPGAKPADNAVCTGTGFCNYQGGGCFCANGMFTCL